MNKVQILGNITKDIEIKYTQSGTAIAVFGIAYNDKRKDQSGNYVDVSMFFDVTAFGRTAENINQYFHKGSRILIDGSLDFQQWEKDGQKRSKVGIKVNGFDFIDKKDTQPTQNAPQPQPGQPQQSNIPEINLDSEEIPF